MSRTVYECPKCHRIRDAVDADGQDRARRFCTSKAHPKRVMMREAFAEVFARRPTLPGV